MALVQAKQALRKQIKPILKGMSQDCIEAQTKSVLKTLFALPQYRNARAISVYLSMPSGEISTSRIVHDALGSGKKVFVPFTYPLQNQRKEWPSAIMDMVELESIQDYNSLEPDKWGIPTPNLESIPNRRNCFGSMGKSEGDHDAESSQSDKLDLIVMPGLAFDYELGRLGHGKGFYDLFLQRYYTHVQKTGDMPYLVGLSLNEQLLPDHQSIPTDATDWKLDALILGNGEMRTLKRNLDASFFPLSTNEMP